MPSASAYELALRLALIGAISGVISGPLVMIGGPFMGTVAEPLVLSFVGFAPGLVFGLMVGGSLYRQGMIDGRVYQAFVAAAAGSCWAATRVTFLLVFDGDEWNPQWGLGAALHHYLPDAFMTHALAGAIGGLIGAALYYGKSRGDSYGQAIYRQVGGWAVGLFLFGLLVPGINNWGHGGGILAGILLGFFLGYQDKTRERLVHKSAAVICLILTGAVLGWAVITGAYLIFTGGR